MKLSIYIYIFAISMLVLSACASNPEIMRTDIESNRRVSVAYLKTLYSGYPRQIKEDMCIEGTIVSSDRFANVYQTLVIEDQTGGIDVKVEYDELFLSHGRGRKVSVYCNSLWLGAYGGLIQLGYAATDEKSQVVAIPLEGITSYVSRKTEPEQEVLPHILRIEELSPRYLSCWVGFDKVQFVDEEMGLAWCDRDMDTDRHLVDIAGDTLIVRTNHHALHAYTQLPSGSGHIEGMLGYFNKKYQLRMTDNYSVVMKSPRFQAVLRDRVEP